MRKLKEWAVYEGDEYFFFGTKEEIKKRLNMKESSFKFLCTKEHKKRIRKAKNPHGYILVDLGYREDNYESK